MSNFILMLTRDDFTVPDAASILETALSQSPASGAM
jgi:hypothetical protein